MALLMKKLAVGVVEVMKLGAVLLKDLVVLFDEAVRQEKVMNENIKCGM